MPSDSNQPPTPPATDFGKAAADYGKWRQGFPSEFFSRLESLGIGIEGQRLLDLGTGTGLLARAFALRGCHVTGGDLSAELLAEARNADRAAGVTVDYVLAPAESTGLADASFDVISAATCWHWFDRPKAAAEARRLLTPNGRLLIAALDWHFRPGNVVEATSQIIRQFCPTPPQRSPSTFAYPAWTQDLTGAGFDDWEAFAFTTQLAYSHDAWRGRVRASAAVGPVMNAATIERFDAELNRALRAKFPVDILPIDHKIFALVAWSRVERG